MTPLNCIIVDDEPLARKILEGYIETLPSLNLIASCKNAGEAIMEIHAHKIDLIICDLKMPGINGLQLIKSLNYIPKVIITTAYSEHAVEGFTLGVTDYLLKPIALERFLLAVNRALGKDTVQHKTTVPDFDDFVFFKTGNTNERVFLKNINYIEAYGNYSKLYLIDPKKVLLINHKISELESELKEKKFYRVHKSYIVNGQYVDKIGTGKLFLSTTEIPLGDNFKKNLHSILKKTE